MRSRAGIAAKHRVMPNRPRDFADLIHILDPELRLITPTDPEGSRAKGSRRITERALLPTHPRLPRPLPAGLADPQAAGDPARTGGTAAGGTVVARGMPSPRTVSCHLALEWANIRLLTKKERLDRAAAQDDEAGGAGAWTEDAGIGHAWSRLIAWGRDRGLWQHCGLRLWWSRSRGWTRQTFLPSSSNSRATAAGLILS